MKQYCNPVEVDVRVRYSPPPATSDGAGYAAACFALAGKIDRARTIIEGIAPAERGAAAGVPVRGGPSRRGRGRRPCVGTDDGARARVLAKQLHGALPRRHVRVFARAEQPRRTAPASVSLGVHAQDGFTANARQALQSIEQANVDRRTGATADEARRLPRLPVRRAVERDSSAIP
jgi:hypothetical protein